LWENREKAGLSKRGRSGTRLHKPAFSRFFSTISTTNRGSSFVCTQTKILENGTWGVACLFEVFARVGVLDLGDNPSQNTSKIHARPLLMHPKRKFGKTKQRVGRVFSSYFARIRSPNRVLTPSQSASKKHTRCAA